MNTTAMDPFEMLVMSALQEPKLAEEPNPQHDEAYQFRPPFIGRASASLLDTLADQACMASPISRGVPMTLDYRQFLPPASDGRPGQRRPRAMSEPWKRGDQDHDEEDDDDDNWSPLEPSIEEDGTSDSITDVLRKYAAIYNKNGRIGIYTREERQAIINKFREKRKRRVWKKKIRYYCRKNLADRRVRVKGRFVKAGSPESIALAAATNGENASSGNTDAATDTTSEDGESDRKARTSASLGKAQEGSLVDRSPIRKAIRKELGEGSLRHGGLKFGDSIFDLVVAAEIAENRDKIEEQLANSDAESKFEEPLHPDGTVAKIGKRTRRHSIAY